MLSDDASGFDGFPDPGSFRTKKEFGAGLTLLRTGVGLTVRDLARAVDVPNSNIGDYTSGKSLPRIDVLQHILLACGVEDPGDIDAWLAAWRRVRKQPGPRSADVCAPYPGLRSFEPDETDWFCGRKRLTEDLVGQLGRLYVEGGLLGVVGPSGSGKSSLLRAGLIPALRAGDLGVPGSSTWRVALFTPGSRPVRELAVQLAQLAGDNAERCIAILVADPEASAGLAWRAAGTAAGLTDGSQLVVVVDQFEEVFTACQDEQERRAFIAALCAVAGQGRSDPAALVVLGLRADFYPHVLEYPALVAALQRHQVLVGPMTEAELREAIIEPARKAKLGVEDGLVEVLLRDLSPAAGHGSPASAHDPGTLPLLSHALRATWDRSHGGTLTVADYRGTGGIRGAVTASAEEVYQGLTPTRQDLARQVFTRLVRIADDTADTRRRVPTSELLLLYGDVRPVLDAFIAKRLITAEADDVQIAHEALLRAWPRLREWISADRAGARVHRQLTAAAENWGDSGRDPSDLYSGGRLAAVEEWAAQEAHQGEFNALEREFLSMSVARRVAEERAAMRRTRLLLQMVAALAAVATAAGLLAVVAFQQKAAIAQQRDLAVSRQVAMEADQLRTSDPALAMQLSLAAYQIAPTAEARTSLLEATGGPLVTRLLGPAGAELNVVAYSPDRTLLALGSADGTVRLWDVAGPGSPAALNPPLAVPSPGSVTSIAFSPDGRTLVAGSSGATVTGWDIADPRRPARLAVLRLVPTGTVSSITFSPGGRLLAAADGRVFLWDVSDLSHIVPLGAPLRAGTGQAGSVAVSPDGGTLAAGTSAGQVLLWRLRTGAAPEMAVVLQAPGPAEAVNGIAFGPDGRTLAAAGNADRVWLWTLAPGHQPVLRRESLKGPASFIYAIAFSPDGNSVAAGSADNNAYIWNLASGTVTAALPHPAPVLSVAFGARGSTLATADTDGAARIWQLPGPVLTGPTAAVFAVAYSPDGHAVAAGSGDGTVRLWDVSDLAHPVSLGNPLTSAGPAADALDGPVAWGPGGRLAAGTASGGIQLWNAADARHPVALPTPSSALTSFVQNVAFDPSGRLMAVASAAGAIELWDTTTFARPEPLAVIRDVPLGSRQGVLAVSIDRGDRVLAAAGDDGSVRLWDITNPRRPRPLGSPLASLTATVYQVTFSPDGSLLAASGEDRKVRLWQVADPARPRLLATLTGPAGIVYDVAFSPDGRTLATSDGDKTVWLWDITDPASPASLGALTGPAQTVFAAVFSPTGNALVAGSQDDTVRLWLASPVPAAQYICSIAGTPITPAEWARYIPGLPYRPPCPG